jgi:DNA-binding Xre family transcriptional regulator
MATNRSHARTAQQIERDKQLRSKYQSTQPSLEALQASGDYLPPITQGEYFEIIGFAMRIKARREEMKLSLADLAAKTGIDKAAICRLENGQVENPTYSTLERIAKALNQRLRLVLEDESTCSQ